MARKRYRLLKDSPELKRGAIMEEDCDDGDQGFSCITKDSIKKDDQGGTGYSRKVVTESPKWFEEVIPAYIPIKYQKKFEEFLKKLK